MMAFQGGAAITVLLSTQKSNEILETSIQTTFTSPNYNIYVQDQKKKHSSNLVILFLTAGMELKKSMRNRPSIKHTSSF